MKKNENEVLTSIVLYNLKVEEVVIGTLWFLGGDHEIVNAVYEALEEDDFHSTRHKIIFKTLKDLHTRKIPVDVLIVQEELVKKGFVDIAEDHIFLIDLVEKFQADGLNEEYIKILKKKSLLREMYFLGKRLEGECLKPDHKDESEILQIAQKEIMKLAHRKNNINKFDNITSTLHDSIGFINSIKDRKSGIHTGFTKLDKILNGFYPGDLIILGARPSVGKSALSLWLGLGAAQNGHATAFLSLEMSKRELGLRLIGGTARVSISKLKGDDLNSDEWERITPTVATLTQYPFYIQESSSELNSIRSSIRQAKMTCNIKFLIVDYLQLINGEDYRDFDNRNQEISSISRALKELARELDIPILALSQLSRNIETRADKRPVLSDLRDSGAIEQDADIVMFLHREGMYNDSSEQNTADLIIAKHRNGPLGIIPMLYTKEYTLFQER